MNPQREESPGTYRQAEDHAQQNSNDRSGLIGLLALLGLAFPALAIRYLFPSLNPMLLAGLGIAVYGVYFGLLAFHAVQSNDPELAAEPIVVTARDSHPFNEERIS